VIFPGNQGSSEPGNFLAMVAPSSIVASRYECS